MILAASDDHKPFDNIKFMAQFLIAGQWYCKMKLAALILSHEKRRQ